MSGRMTRLAARAHQHMLLQEAEGSSPPVLPPGAVPRLWNRILLHVGDLLIAGGWKLYKRYGSAVNGCGEVHPSPAGSARA
jgi:hypothetical protein